ncbi:MAG: alpha/beta fold hydrolase [Candidatus Roizmanbacteria bacterium]
MKKGHMTIEGSQIYYESSGKGEPLIFIHADTLDLRQWKRQVDYFSNHYKVIAFDIRGFGKSDIPHSKEYSFAGDLHYLMNELRVNKAHIVGLSLGGAIAIDFALIHPDMLLSLTLADSGIEGDTFAQRFLDEISKIIIVAKEGDLDLARRKWLNLDILSFSRTIPDVWREVKQMVTDTSCYRWFGQNQPVTQTPDAANRLHEIKVPTLILVGEYDIDDFQRKSKLLNDNISGSKFATISMAGHLSNMDNPVRFNEELSVFLNSVKSKSE